MVNNIKNGLKNPLLYSAILALAGCSKNASDLGMNKDHKDVVYTSKNLYSDTPRNLQEFKSLLKQNVIRNEEDCVTALKLAAGIGVQAVESLLKQEGINANVNLQDECGLTALHLSSLQGVECLLKQEGINVNLQDGAGNTVLHSIMYNGTHKLEKVKCLLNKGINVNVLNQAGNTALHYAVDHDSIDENERVEIVRCLLSKENIDVNVTNHKGATALSLARAKNKTEIVDLLLNKMNKIVRVHGFFR